MLQAIQVEYLEPTNTRGSYYKASGWTDSVTLPTNHAINGNENAKRAAKALTKKMRWNVSLVGGLLASGVYVFTPIAKRKVRAVARRSR